MLNLEGGANYAVVSPVDLYLNSRVVISSLTLTLPWIRGRLLRMRTRNPRTSLGPFRLPYLGRILLKILNWYILLSKVILKLITVQESFQIFVTKKHNMSILAKDYPLPNKYLDGQNFFWSHKIAQTLSHVLGTNLLDQYFCPKNSPTQKIEEF